MFSCPPNAAFLQTLERTGAYKIAWQAMDLIEKGVLSCRLKLALNQSR